MGSNTMPSGSQYHAQRLEQLTLNIRVVLETMPLQEMLDNIKERILIAREAINLNSTTVVRIVKDSDLLKTVTMWLDEQSAKIAQFELSFKSDEFIPSTKLLESVVSDIRDFYVYAMYIIEQLGVAFIHAFNASQKHQHDTIEYSSGGEDALNVGDLHHRLTESTSEIRRLNNAIEELEKNVDKVEEKLKHEQELGDTREGYIRRVEQEVEERDERIEELKTDVKNVKAEREDLSRELIGKTAECQNLEEVHSPEQRARKDAKLAELQRKNLQITEHNGFLEQQNDSLISKLDAVRDDNMKLKKETEKLRLEVASNRRDMIELHEELHALDRDLDQDPFDDIPIESELEGYSPTNPTEGGKIATIQHQCDELSGKVTLLKNELADRDAEIIRLKAYSLTKPGEGREIANMQRQRDELSSKVALPETKVRDRTAQVVQLNNPREPTKVANLEQAQVGNSRMIGRSPHGELRMLDTKDEINDLTAENASLKGQIEEILRENEHNETYQACEEFLRLKKEIDMLEQMFHFSSNVAEELGERNANLQQQIALHERREKEDGRKGVFSWVIVICMGAAGLALATATAYFREFQAWRGANGTPEERYRDLVLRDTRY